jgi:hypothetical protein
VSGAQSPARRSSVRSPIATPDEVAREATPFPSKDDDRPIETFFPDWRRRLTRNLSRRSDSRWEPLTWVHAAKDLHRPIGSADMSSRPFAAYRDTPLWSAVETTIGELTSTREVSVNTATDYVIGYVCQELVAKKLIVSSGLQK